MKGRQTFVGVQELAIFRADPEREKVLGIKDYVVCRDCGGMLRDLSINHKCIRERGGVKAYRQAWGGAALCTPNGLKNPPKVTGPKPRFMKLPVALQHELAELVGLSIQTLREWRKQGRIPAFKNGAYTQADIAGILICKEKAKKSRRRRVARAMRGHWKEPGYRKRTIKAITAGSNTRAALNAKSQAIRESWKDDEIRKRRIDGKVRAEADPKLKKRRRRASKRAWARDDGRRRDATRAMMLGRWARQKKLPTKPPHRPKSEDTAYRIIVVANCRLQGLNDYKIPPYAYPLQHRKATAWRTTQTFLRRNDDAIRKEIEQLSKLHPLERKALVQEAEEKLRTT